MFLLDPEFLPEQFLIHSNNDSKPGDNFPRQLVGHLRVLFRADAFSPDVDELKHGVKEVLGSEMVLALAVVLPVLVQHELHLLGVQLLAHDQGQALDEVLVGGFVQPALLEICQFDQSIDTGHHQGMTLEPSAFGPCLL